MKLIIANFYTTPGHTFQLEPITLQLLTETIERQLFENYPFENTKAKEIEIWLDTQPEGNLRKVQTLWKKQRKRLSFGFWLPYFLIVENNTVNLPVFIHEFIEALRTVLVDYCKAPDNVYDAIKKQLTEEVSGKAIYDYKSSRDDEWLKKIQLVSD